MNHLIAKEQVESFRRDGVVCARSVFDPGWIDIIRRGIGRNLERPGQFFRDHTSEDSPGRYVFDFWNWQAIPEFREVMFASPLGALGATLLGSDRVTMLMDNWFVREAGARDSAPWHHDEPYFDFSGAMCIVWIPLEPVKAPFGLEFVLGSHRWGKLFAARQFSNNVPFDCVGDEYHPMPEFDGGEHELASWDLDPGDCLAFDFRTIHRGGSESAPEDSHRMTFRLGGDNVRFEPRGGWTREISEHLVRAGQRAGRPLDNPLTPVIHPAG